MRSTFTSLAMPLLALFAPFALFAVTTGTPAHAAPQAAASRESSRSMQGSMSAPDCVHLTVDWRYTFVSNDCSSTYTLTVAYLDGTEVPCRTAAPGDRITFPGRGTQGNEVLGAVLCDSGGSA
ncbi:alpha-amylase [Streptomyces viridochromogenes]|nr:alpha-amylase [Streptomyces viridochromogenes]